MPEAVHQGGCHCGKVRFEATTDLAYVITCNCSICTKHGLLFTFLPAARFKLLGGEEQLQEYLFNRGNIRHTFCRDCGVETFGRGKNPDGVDMVAVNVRCLDGVDPGALPRRAFDGRHWEESVDALGRATDEESSR